MTENDKGGYVIPEDFVRAVVRYSERPVWRGPEPVFTVVHLSVRARFAIWRDSRRWRLAAWIVGTEIDEYFGPDDD